MGDTPDFFTDLRRVGEFKRLRMDRRPSNPALSKAIEPPLSRDTVGAWLQGERFPRELGTLLAVLELIRGEAARRGLLGSRADTSSDESVAQLLDAGRWKRTWKAELRRRTRSSHEALERRQALGTLAEEERRARQDALADRPRPVRHWTPKRLGVHPAVPGGPTTRGGADFVLPSYVARPHDAALRTRLVAAVAGAESLLVVVRGESCTGKTRTAVEALTAVPDDFRLFVPADADSLLAILDAKALGPRTAVWLNEAQHYLGGPAGEAVAAALLRRLDDDGPFLAFATLWPDHDKALTAPPRSGGPDIHRQARTLLAQAHLVRLPVSFADDLDAVRDTARHDTSLATALQSGGSDITQVLAAGPDLVAHYEDPAGPHGPYGKALISAAMDAHRLGVPGPLPLAFLEKAAPGYLTCRERAAADPDSWFADALTHARTLIKQVVRPLQDVPRPSGMGAVPGVVALADYLRQHGRTRRHDAVPPDSFWQAALDHAPCDTDRRALARAAEERGRLRHAALLLHRAAHGGDRESAAQLARLLDRAGRAEEARAWWRRAAETGDVRAMVTVGTYLQRDGQDTEALRWWSEAADAGDMDAPCLMAYHLDAAGRGEEARHWWERANQAQREYYYVNRSIMQFLLAEGRSDEAITWAPRPTSLSGGTYDWKILARLLHRQGRTDDAITWWLRLIDTKDPDDGDYTDVLREAADVMVEAGRTEEAIGWLRDLADRGDWHARGEFVKRLKALGRVDEAIPWLKDYAAVRATTVNDHTVGWVADLLEDDGRAPEALAWLRQWAAAGDCPALARALASLQAGGRSAEALRWLAADGPGSPAGVDSTRPLCRMSGLLQAAGHRSLGLLLVQEAADPLGTGGRLLLWSAEAYVRSRPDMTAAQAVEEWEEARSSLDASGIMLATILLDATGAYEDVLSRLTAARATAPPVGVPEDEQQVRDWMQARIDSANPRAIATAACVAERSGHPDEALSAYRYLHDTGHGWYAAPDRTPIVQLLEAQGRVDEAVHHLWGEDGDPGFVIRSAVAALLTRSGRLDDAVTRLLRSDDFSGVARLHEEAGRTEAAATAWRQSADAGNRHALDDAVRLLEREGRAGRARQLRRCGWNQDGTIAEPWTCPDATAPFGADEPLPAL
jgi:tetratricopeptide (TPR) repeat protein